MLCFVKQRTAYEVRISDWISDVCSSDLSLAAASLLFSMAAGAQDAATADAAAPLPTIPVGSDQPPPVPATATGDDQQGLAEIIVTAQKREQSLHDVPISVTAVGSEQLRDINASDLTDVALYVPNARVDTADQGSPQVFIRGFGTNTFNPSFESSVGFVEDEIFYGRGAYFTEATFDVDRVEILRGPQGTLFGKNTVAGLYNVITAGPTQIGRAHV